MSKCWNLTIILHQKSRANSLFTLILSLSKDAVCNRWMVRRAHHERMKKEFGPGGDGLPRALSVSASPCILFASWGGASRMIGNR